MQMQARPVWLPILSFDFSFHFLSCLAFPELSSLRTHFRLFTEVVRKITARGYDEDLENFRERETKTGEERFLPSLNTVSVLKGGDCH